MLKAIVTVAASLLMIGGLIAVFSSGSVSPSSPSETTDLNWSPQCSTESNMVIKGAGFGYYLKPGTTSGSTVRFTSGSSSRPPVWSVIQTDSNAIDGQARRAAGEWYIKSSGMYLQYDENSLFSPLKMVSTGSPGSNTKFVLESDRSTGECNRFFIKVAGSNNYLQGGTFSADLDTHTRDAFFVESEGTGYSPCGLTNDYRCTSQKTCKTGISVPWTDSTLTPSLGDRESVESASQGTCNSHCLTCYSWDSQSACKPCGGTIDKTGEMSQSGGQNHTQYFRQCDCNSAYKAQISLASLLVLFAAIGANLH